MIVATVRALKMHGGLTKDQLGTENIEGLRKGLVNLGRHIENVRKFGVEPVVGINNFTSDTAAEHQLIIEFCKKEYGVDAVICQHWAKGSAGIEELAHKVVAVAEAPRKAPFAPIYKDEMPLVEKMRTIVREVYRATDIVMDAKVKGQFDELEKAGYGHLPVCVAKTQYTFSTDPNQRGAPTGHTIPVRELRLSAGAGFIVVICGEVMTMPGLPKVPSAEKIFIGATGNIEGLF